jgi:beta-barrel assembly-enhancing protease
MEFLQRQGSTKMNLGRSIAPASKALLVLFIALVAGRVFAAEETPINDLPDRITAVQALNEQIARAADKVTNEDWTAALPLLKAAIESPVFDDLPVERRHALLTSTSGVALQLADNKLAQSYSKRACALPNATAADWDARLYASFGLGDMTDAAEALTHIANQTPKGLTDIKDSTIFRILGELKKSPTPVSKSYDLIAALFGAHWKIDGLFEPSSEWRDYALALVARGRVNEAKSVIIRIRQPSVLISMRVDKRFDPLVKSNPRLFNIDKAVETNIADLRDIMSQSPRDLQSVIELTYALLKARRYDEVLTLTDVVVQKANDRNSASSAYDDVNDYLIWILNNRAIALGGVGRRDEELELLIRAARRPEHGELNVSQAINLGQFYCELGRPKDALFAILDVRNTSPYGQLQVETVHLCAALQVGDKDATALALSYLKEHQADSFKTYQSALVSVEDFDGAAALLIRRLNDPSTRADALTEVQNYVDPADLSLPVKSRERFRAVVNRNDVQQSINKVGRIESFNLRSDLQ